MKPSAFLQNKDLTTEAAVAAALALGYRDPSEARVIYDPANGLPPVFVGPKGIHLESLERFQTSPHRPTIVVALDTARDLHAYVLAQTGKFKTKEEGGGFQTALNPVLFADREDMQLTAFIDYHHIAESRWLDHSASVHFKNSHQFAKWKAANNKKMSQESFALFIDEVINDFVTPSGADMLSFATCIDTHSETTFKNAVSLADGKTQLIWTDNKKGDVSTNLVEEFTIGIPIWQNGQPVKITAKLFHRIEDVRDNNGNLTGQKTLKFWFTLRHLDNILDALFAEEVGFLRVAFDGIAPIYAGKAPKAPTAITLTGERAE
jgi:uncharacterized protein YfdQ (DUF2303 family)